MSNVKIFEDLRIWQDSHVLTLEIYTLTKSFPKEEVYGLVSQLRRAASSVPTNIVEGFYRNTTKELKYLPEKEYISLRERYENIKKSTNALIKSLKNK